MPICQALGDTPYVCYACCQQPCNTLSYPARPQPNQTCAPERRAPLLRQSRAGPLYPNPILPYLSPRCPQLAGAPPPSAEWQMLSPSAAETRRPDTGCACSASAEPRAVLGTAGREPSGLRTGRRLSWPSVAATLAAWQSPRAICQTPAAQQRTARQPPWGPL